ncbi:hypothetical protein [Alteribacillus sp. YIM 98480]|uniref:hypothetical protein n=1 Tax=Alteribacillus sp. YIM 98480 TaxID=2606599 RepID=UPI00131DEE23|nr:hypothetical protein [Alteribacillus sp. YIM 98480]
MSSFSAYSLETVRQWKAKISFPYANPPGLSLVSKALALFLYLKVICFMICFRSKECPDNIG